MSYDPKLVLNIPYETSLSAHQIYSNNHIYIQIGDSLERIFNQIDISHLDSTSHMNIEIVYRLALAGAFQFAESLPDPSAASATMKRIDWKYALFLPLSHPGISINSLCNFRQSLGSSSSALQEFGNLLEILGGFGIFSHTTSPWLDPKETLSLICQTNRLFSVTEGMKSALGLVVSIAPEWVKGQISPHWYQRYKTGSLRSPEISQASEIQNYANRVGTDIFALLTAFKKTDVPDFDNKAEIRQLTHLFQDQYFQNGDIIQWRMPSCANCLCSNQLIEGGLQ